jgi:hypothetical protein
MESRNLIVYSEVKSPSPVLFCLLTSLVTVVIISDAILINYITLLLANESKGRDEEGLFSTCSRMQKGCKYI